MATHAQIGLERPDGSIKGIFVWYNGYPSFTGKILTDNYTSEDKINELLDLGALLVLGAKPVGIFKDEDNPDGDFCIKMKNEGTPDEFVDEDEFIDDRIDFTYLFKDGKWLVSEFDHGFEQLQESLTEKKVELDVYDFDQEEYFTPDEQEEYGIDEHGEEIDGYETWHHCAWCGEPFPDSELRKEIQFGWLCDRCAGALWSRGEKLALIESAGKETSKDFAEAIVPIVERYIKNLGGENYDEWAEVQLVSDMKKLYNRFFDGTNEHGLITQFIDEIMTDPEGVLKLYKAVLNEELEVGDNILDAVCFIPMTEEGRWAREITPEALKEHRGFIEVDGHRVASFEEFWPDLTFGERYPLAQNHEVVMVGRTPYIKVTGSLINGDDSDRYVDEDLEIEKDGKTFVIKKTDRMAPDSKFDVFCGDKHCGMFDSVEAASAYINDEASKELHENDEPEYLSDKVTQVLDDYGILYGDIVENGDGTVNIVGVDEDEWQEVVDAISAELGLDVLVPDEDHDELDNELIVTESCHKKELKEGKKDLTTVVKDSYKHMGDIGKENPNLDDIIDDILNNYEGYGEEGDSPEKMTAFTSAVKQELNSLGLPFVEFEDEGLKEKIEQQPDLVYKGFTIEHFPMEWHYADKTWDQDGYIIHSPYYLQSTSEKPKTYLPLFCEDEYGEVLNFKTLEDAKNYIDNYIVPKKGKIKIKAPYGGSDEVHFELLPEYRKEKEDIDEGAQGKKTPGREWIIYKVESPYRIVATRSTYVEAQDFVNRWNRKHEAEEEVTLDDVPLGRFKKGDNYPELYYEDLNEAFTNLVESSWVIKSTELKDGSHLSVAWEKGQGYYVTCSHDPFKDETGATVYRTKFRDHYNNEKDAVKAYDEIVEKDGLEEVTEAFTFKKDVKKLNFFKELNDLLDEYLEGKDDPDDTFAGTEDSYASEMFQQHVDELISMYIPEGPDADDLYSKIIEGAFEYPDQLQNWINWHLEHLREDVEPKVLKINPDSKKVVVDIEDKSKTGEEGHPIQKGLRGPIKIHEGNLKEANMSGNWVMLKPEEVEGLPTIEQVQKAYKEKYGRNITVTEVDAYGYNYAFREQEFRAFTPDIEGREAFWVVVHRDEAPLDEDVNPQLITKKFLNEYKPKDDYLTKFDERTHAHIDRVNKYAKKLGKEYPDHDSDKFLELFDGYSLMGKENVTEEEQKLIDDATYKHVLNNEHHCEHWCNPEDIKGFSRANPTPNGCLDCSKMPESALEEMCCDWCAMSEEFKNSPFEWYEKNKDTRWHFNEEQDKFILDTLHKLWDENLDEGKELEETVEKHDTLNPKLWNEDKTLKPEVEEKIKEIVNNFVEALKEDEIKIDVDDIILVGSNCSYNYNNQSDLDIHIIANEETFDCPEKHLDKLYSAYRSLFNNKYDINFYGIPVEIYVEPKENPTAKSNGLYSLNNGWVREPVQEDIPEVNQEEIDKEVQPWLDRADKIIENPSVEEIENFITDIYDLRKSSIEQDGEYGIGNLVFKEIRGAGILDLLKTLKADVAAKNMSLGQGEGSNEGETKVDLVTPLEEDFSNMVSEMIYNTTLEKRGGTFDKESGEDLTGSDLLKNKFAVGFLGEDWEKPIEEVGKELFTTTLNNLQSSKEAIEADAIGTWSDEKQSSIDLTKLFSNEDEAREFALLKNQKAIGVFNEFGEYSDTIYLQD